MFGLTPLIIFNSVLTGLLHTIALKSLPAIVYLAVMGTATGFPLYCYGLKNYPLMSSADHINQTHDSFITGRPIKQRINQHTIMDGDIADSM